MRVTSSHRPTGQLLLFIGLTLFVPMMGCDAGDGTDNGSDAGVDDTDVVGSLIDWYSDYLETCYPRAKIFSIVEPGDDRFQFDYQEIVDNLEALWRDESTVAVDEAAAAECLAAIEPLLDTCGELDTANEACENMFSGKVENGNQCEDSIQCVSRNCVYDDNGCGLCEPFLSLGEDCTNDSFEELGECNYDADEYCNYETKKCETFLNEGDTCVVDDTTYECGSPASCDSNTGLCVGPAGEGENCDERSCDTGLEEVYDDEDACTCETISAPKEEGDACEPDEPGSCDLQSTALVCIDLDDDGSWTCTPITAANEGEECDATIFSGDAFGGENAYEGTTLCLNAYTSHYCDISAGAETGTCKQKASDGETCYDNDDYTPCQWPETSCVAGGDQAVCENNATLGESCVDIGCVWPLECDFETDVCVDFDNEEPVCE